MRQEIEEQIEKNGTADEEVIREIYKRSLRQRGRPEQEIERIAANKNTILKMKYTINLANKSIQDEEIEEIAQMIVNKKPHTKQIFLTKNLLSDPGAIKLVALFKNLEHLTLLDLQSNNIGEEGMYALFELCASKPKLDLALSGNKIVYADMIEDIKQKAQNAYRKNKI